MRAANPGGRHEALTSRPLLLAAVGRATSHAGQTLLHLTPMHAETGLIKSMIANVQATIRHVRMAAEQLPKLDRWRALPAYICHKVFSHNPFFGRGLRRRCLHRLTFGFYGKSFAGSPGPHRASSATTL